MITNQLLYQLSYTGVRGTRSGRTANENTSKIISVCPNSPNQIFSLTINKDVDALFEIAIQLEVPIGYPANFASNLFSNRKGNNKKSQ